jgi:transcriptional regulator with XRE-family HTH domain
MDEDRGVHPIKEALKRAWPPMSQSKLARRMDIGVSTLNLYLSGKRTPPEGFYIAAAAVLGCEPDELRPAEEAAAV